MCLPWQQWTESSVWFDDVGITAFHSCVVDLWPPLSERRLLLSVFWCAIAKPSELVKLGESGREIREMLVQVYGIML
jgi:hypothetical protein